MTPRRHPSRVDPRIDPRLLDECETVLLGAGDAESRLGELMHLLRERVDHYDWVGLYVLDGTGDELVLGPYAGPPTEHTRIPVGEGICGAAVAEEQTVNVPDVDEDPRYLACFASTRSELVVPIWQGADVVGEIDVDSDRPEAFSDEDEELLEELGRRIAKDVASLRG